MALPTDIQNDLLGALNGNTAGVTRDEHLSFAFSLSGAFGAALGGAVVTNNITDTTRRT